MQPTNLFDVLVKKSQRETAGADTSLRYSYQQSYALLEIIRRHALPHSYAVAFEFHDDVVFFDDETSPARVDFAQVKTTNSKGAKRLHSLYSSKDGKNSVIGKLIRNLDGLPEGVKGGLLVVCNKEYDFSDKNIDYENLPSNYKLKIKEKLNQEIENFDEATLNTLSFHVTDVAIDKMDTYLRGKALELFETHFSPQDIAASQLWLLVVSGEVKRRNNTPIEEVQTVHDLLKKKALTRGQVEDLLVRCQKSESSPPSYIEKSYEVAQTLGLSLRQQGEFSRAVTYAYTSLYDPLDKGIARVAFDASKLIEEVDGEDVASIIEQLGSIVMSVAGDDERFDAHIMAKALGYVLFSEQLSTSTAHPAFTGTW